MRTEQLGRLLQSQESTGRTPVPGPATWATKVGTEVLRIWERGHQESRTGCVRITQAEANLMLLLIVLESGPEFGNTAF